MIKMVSSFLETGRPARCDDAELPVFKGDVRCQQASVFKAFITIGDRIESRNRVDIAVDDQSIEALGKIRTVEIEEVEGDKAEDEGHACDACGALQLPSRAKSQA